MIYSIIDHFLCIFCISRHPRSTLHAADGFKCFHHENSEPIKNSSPGENNNGFDNTLSVGKTAFLFSTNDELRTAYPKNPARIISSSCGMCVVASHTQSTDIACQLQNYHWDDFVAPGHRNLQANRLQSPSIRRQLAPTPNRIFRRKG
jgi:hypothetical protein